MHKYFRSADVAGAYTRVQIKPSTGYDGTIRNIRLYDLTDVHPSNVVCNVIANVTDSLGGNATSDYVTVANVEHPYNPLCWYLPGETWASGDVIAHEPYPLIEPVVGTAASRISPVSAMAAGLLSWSNSEAGGNRPILVMQAAVPGSGLAGSNGSQWVKDSTETPHGGTAYASFLAMLTAMNALTPAHEIRAAVTTLLTNDRTGADYNIAHAGVPQEFVANIRADTGVPSLPVIWQGIAQQFEDGAAPDYDGGGGLTYRGQRMRDFQASLDQDSGSANAIPGVHHVAGLEGQTYSWANYDEFGVGDGMNTPDANGFHLQVHLNALGQNESGRRNAAKIVEVLTA
ncbi:MAG: hypothetical protein ACRBBQ_13625 [Cognatishimia sp.]